MSKTYSKTRTLVECALMVAIGTVLAQIKILDMPMGGSVTLLSMLPFVVVALRHGTKWGLLTGFANSLLQMLLGGVSAPAGTVASFMGVVMLDYVLAFTVLGLAGFFAKPLKNKLAGVCLGTAVVLALRFVCSFLSGALIWSSFSNVAQFGQAALFSLTYNGAYMLPELVFTTLAVCAIYKIAPKVFEA